jgi:hypothetical protein
VRNIQFVLVVKKKEKKEKKRRRIKERVVEGEEEFPSAAIFVPFCC